MIGEICNKCGHIGHPTYALGRFRPEGPTGYMGVEGLVRSTRLEAQLDVCAKRVEEEQSS